MAVRRGAAVAVEGETAGEAAAEVGVNEVRLVGRVSAEPETRSMPSGDEVVLLRVVVRRPPEPPPSRSAAARVATRVAARAASPAATGEPPQRSAPRPSVDTIDVSCWTSVTRRAALRLAEGDVVELEGSLRRRFYRAGPTVQSRYDVVAAQVRRAARARP